MKIQKLFTIIVSISAVTLLGLNVGCRMADKEIKFESSKVTFMPLDPYRNFLVTSTKSELLPLIDAAIAKHADKDLTALKNMVANEKLVAAKYTDLDKRFSNSRFYKKDLSVFDDYMSAFNSKELEMVRCLLDKNPLLTNKELQEQLKDCADAESSEQKLERNYLKEANEVVDAGLAFYASRRYDSMNDADLLQRVKENIAAKVQSLYFVVAEKQRVLNMYVTLLEDCRSRYELIEKLRKSRQITAFRAAVEIKRYEEMENFVKQYAAEVKAISYLLSQYTGVNAKDGGYLLADDAVLSAWFLADSVVDKRDNQTSLTGSLSYAEFQQLAAVGRRELAFFNRDKVIDVKPFATLANKELQGNLYYMTAIRSLVEFKDAATRYDWYFYPDKTEFEKRAPLMLGVLANVKSAYDDVMATDRKYMAAYRSLRENQEGFAKYLTKVNAIHADEVVGYWERVDRNSVSDLTSLDIDSKRFALVKQEAEAMEIRSKSYDAWCMLLNAVGDQDIISKSIVDAKKNLKQYMKDAAKEFAKDATSDQTKEVSPDVIPTVRYVDVDYIDAYKK